MMRKHLKQGRDCQGLGKGLRKGQPGVGVGEGFTKEGLTEMPERSFWSQGFKDEWELASSEGVGDEMTSTHTSMVKHFCPSLTYSMT